MDTQSRPVTEYDVLVIGAGAGGMATAITAAKAGLAVVIVEKADVFGGTTAFSGGVLWIPGNRHCPPGDIDRARSYRDVADWILFDAKASKDLEGALPGGNALSFDWRMLAEQAAPAGGLPWLLSGGLNIDNLANAVRISGARSVDVSSGVESVQGKKNPELVRRFLALSATL